MVNKKRKLYLKKYFANPVNWERHLATAKRWRDKNPLLSRRKEILDHYGNGDPKCLCCGEREVKFLALDHINGGGNKHRKEAKGNMCWWIIKNNFPPIFQILCHNCNQAKGYYGQCPHIEVRNPAKIV